MYYAQLTLLKFKIITLYLWEQKDSLKLNALHSGHHTVGSNTLFVWCATWWCYFDLVWCEYFFLSAYATKLLSQFKTYVEGKQFPVKGIWWFMVLRISIRTYNFKLEYVVGWALKNIIYNFCLQYKRSSWKIFGVSKQFFLTNRSAFH